MTSFRILMYEGQKFLGETRQSAQPPKKYLKSLFMSNDRINEILVQREVSKSERIQGNLCSEICIIHALRKFGQIIFLGYS